MGSRGAPDPKPTPKARATSVYDAKTFDYRGDLSCWFGLSYASFLTMPRVLMEAMPSKWQEQMAFLLHEYDDTFTNMPEDAGTRVMITKNGKLTKTPPEITNYRHPDHKWVESLKGGE